MFYFDFYFLGISIMAETHSLPRVPRVIHVEKHSVQFFGEHLVDYVCT